MVVVKRRSSISSSSRPEIQEYQHERSPISVGFGGGRDSPLPPSGGVMHEWISPAFKVLSPNSSRISPTKRLSFSSLYKEERSSNMLNRLIKIVYGIAIISWIVAKFSGVDVSVVSNLENETIVINSHIIHLKQDLKSLQKKIANEKNLLSKLKRTRNALNHEVRMFTELKETGSTAMKQKPKNANTIKEWLQHRRDGLLSKIQILQRYLQARSRDMVLERMGPGPYRVQFTIVIANDTGKRNFKKFVVELAPLNLMPHAVHFFLDMVNAGIWDNTVFLHHEKLDHVIAAAPIDCETHEIKNIPIQKLGWSTMGFPEYADELPHSKYTLAFSGNGPTFYINTLDNTKTHGPGVQGHYLLPEEADPVFATVVDGTDVVDEMIEFGIHQQKPPKVEGHPWADEPHTWSRIVNVRVLKS